MAHKMCEHLLRFDNCIVCNSEAYCTHGRKYRCKECGGDGRCPHGNRKYTCKECGGSGLCPHGNVKCTCVECGGGGVCPHGKRKQYIAKSVVGIYFIKPLSVRHMQTRITKDTACVALFICSRVKKINVTIRRRRRL